MKIKPNTRCEVCEVHCACIRVGVCAYVRMCVGVCAYVCMRVRVYV